MSAKFDKTNLTNKGDWLKADDATHMPPSLDYSVSLWVYFESHVSANPETVWFYGASGAGDKYLVLEGVYDLADETRLQVRLKEPGDTELATGTSAVLSTGTWHLVTVVVTLEEETKTRLTLYVDNQSTVTAIAELGTTSESDYDRFALGRWAGSTADSEEPCSFHAEQVAVWDVKLTKPNHEDMWTDNIPPQELGISSEPSIGYWVLAGHHRNGLRTSTDLSQRLLHEGDLFNEAGGSQPNLTLSAEANPGPLWSVKTPALLYETTGTLGTVPNRPPKVAPSRVNPQFFFWNKPEMYEPWKTTYPGEHPMWDHPNMIVMARLKYDRINDEQMIPPSYDTLDNYEPKSYLTNVAKRIADWFEYQGFSYETGSEGDGHYEGSIFIQDLGTQDKKGSPPYLFGRDVQDTTGGAAGKGYGFPIELHPKDKVSDASTYPVSTWFRANGETLGKEYSEELWPLVKAELDRRGLAYPKRMHWDAEDSPRDERMLPGGGANTSTFPLQLTDDRGNLSSHPTNPGEKLANDMTLGDMWADAPTAVTEYNEDEAPWHVDNQPWTRWYAGWNIAIRDQALSTAIMGPALTEFPSMQWSNYNDFIADNANYFFPPNEEWREYNTQSIKPLGGFSSFEAYAPTRPDEFGSNWGMTVRSKYRKVLRARIDACVNASDPGKLAPWLPLVGFVNPNSELTMSREDLRFALQYAWQRGCNEFIMWGYTYNDFDTTYEECDNLTKVVKCMMNTNGSRTCRMGRTYRHCR